MQQKKFQTIRYGGISNALQLELVSLMMDLAGQLNRLPRHVEVMQQTMQRRNMTMAEALVDQLRFHRERILADHKLWRNQPAVLEASTDGRRVSLWGTSSEVAAITIPEKYIVNAKQKVSS